MPAVLGPDAQLLLLAVGRKQWNVYDEVGRRVKGIQNTTWASGTPAPEDEDYTGSSDSDKDVITRTIFDAQGSQPEGQKPTEVARRQ